MRFEVILLFIWGVVMVLIGTWLHKERPSKGILRKYPKSFLYRFLLYPRKCRNEIKSEDLEIFERYRKIIIVQYVLLVIPAIVFFIYLYISFLR